MTLSYQNDFERCIFMAIVSTGWQLSVSLVDNGANTTTKTYDLRSADAAAALIDSNIIIANLIAVTDAVISSYRIAEVFSEDALVYPPAGIENENKASLTLLLDAPGNKKANEKIPAPNIGIFVATSGPSANVVDVGDVALVAYTDIFNAGGQAYISDGEDAVSVLSGKRVSAKNNNG